MVSPNWHDTSAKRQRHVHAKQELLTQESVTLELRQKRAKAWLCTLSGQWEMITLYLVIPCGHDLQSCGSVPGALSNATKEPFGHFLQVSAT